MSPDEETQFAETLKTLSTANSSKSSEWVARAAIVGLEPAQQAELLVALVASAVEVGRRAGTYS